jgi:sRNA-binding protein
VVCYCDDCQAFAHALGCADRVLDANGATEIFQISPARVEFSAGRERLACLRLRRAALRWYTSCCRTPVGNTLASRQVPFVGLVLGRADAEPERRARDAALGPCAALQRALRRRRSQHLDAHDRVPSASSWPAADHGRRAAARRHARSPFFCEAASRRVPRVLTDEELAAALRAAYCARMNFASRSHGSAQSL